MFLISLIRKRFTDSNRLRLLTKHKYKKEKKDGEKTIKIDMRHNAFVIFPKFKFKNMLSSRHDLRLLDVNQ